jgi:hypothetical protein
LNPHGRLVLALLTVLSFNSCIPTTSTPCLLPSSIYGSRTYTLQEQIQTMHSLSSSRSFSHYPVLIPWSSQQEVRVVGVPVPCCHARVLIWNVLLLPSQEARVAAPFFVDGSFMSALAHFMWREDSDCPMFFTVRNVSTVKTFKTRRLHLFVFHHQSHRLQCSSNSSK